MYCKYTVILHLLTEISDSISSLVSFESLLAIGIQLTEVGYIDQYGD